MNYIEKLDKEIEHCKELLELGENESIEGQLIGLMRAKRLYEGINWPSWSGLRFPSHSKDVD